MNVVNDFFYSESQHKKECSAKMHNFIETLYRSSFRNLKIVKSNNKVK